MLARALPLALLAPFTACASPASDAPRNGPVTGLYQVRGSVVESAVRGLDRSMTVLDAAMLESELNGLASLPKVRLERGSEDDRMIVDIDLTDIYERGVTTYNVLVAPGDTLVFDAE